MIPNEGGYSRGNMQGSAANYQSGGLQDLLDRMKGGGWGKVAGMAGSMIPKQGVGNVAGGALSGGATGSSIGSMIAPGVGTAIGGAIGAIGGAIKGGVDWKAQQHQKQTEALMGIRNRMQ